MAVVNRITKTKDLKTWKDFSDKFVQLILKESANFDEVRLIFDRYIDGSLKERTRDKRTSGRSIKYKVNDSINEELEAFQTLGSSNALPSEITVNGLLMFVQKLYLRI